MARSRSSVDTISVLHVDDDEAFASLTAAYLEQEHDGFSVTVESGVENGLSRLTNDEFDCIVSDYEMPGSDGMGFLSRVRVDRPDLPFIMFTGTATEEIARDAISAGVTDYLKKGVGTAQYAVLANRICDAVALYRYRRSVER